MRIIGNAGNSARKVQAVASGALASGDTVVVNSDGTVSVVDATAGPSGFGSSVVFNAANTNPIVASFDNNSNKVVIAYRDYGNSSYGTAVVGTVSGSSISFGSPVVFESATIDYPAITFDSSSNKIVIAYKDEGNSNYGTAIIGTVSGSSISFGSPAVFQSGNFFYTDLVFDSNSNKVVINYNPEPNYYLTATVGSVSGTSISFGTPVVAVSVNGGQARSTFDSNSNKIVTAYREGSNYGTGFVGTVSGSSISFGSPVVFDSSSTADSLSATFDSNSNKVVFGYRAIQSSNIGKAVVGTVSGSSISFGTAVSFSGTNGIQNETKLAFDTSTNKVSLVYREGVIAGYGELIVGTVSGTSISFSTAIRASTLTFSSYFPTIFDSSSNSTVIVFGYAINNHGYTSVYAPNSTNLTSENFIGIASNGYADTQAATINAKGFIDDNQTGLTPGQSYYVQSDGTLGTTAGDPSVFAGTAVSANKLIVKG
jgi:hypothetical protein